jgi:L,D-transpeptidase catalytic domain
VTAVLAFLIIDAVGKDGASTGSTTAPGVFTRPSVTVPTVSAPAPSRSSAGAVKASDSVPDSHVNPSSKKQKAPRFALASVRPGHRIALHASPGGRVLGQVGDRTEFDSTRVFWIEQVKGSWFGVPTSDLPNNELAWIRNDPVALEISQTRYWLSADISRRQLALHYGDRIVERMTVTVGSDSSPTPLGNYSITDGLAGRGLGPWYGCCVLALSGHQDRLPSGWIGGNRIAIHGTPGAIGGADSHGCLRASDPDMIALFSRVSLGTPVFIRA